MFVRVPVSLNNQYFIDYFKVTEDSTLKFPSHNANSVEPVLALTVKIRTSQDFLAPISEVLVIIFFSLTFRNSTSTFLNAHLWSKTAILRLNNT